MAERKQYKPRIHWCKEDRSLCGGSCDMFNCKYFLYAPDEPTGILSSDYYEKLRQERLEKAEQRRQNEK